MSFDAETATSRAKTVRYLKSKRFLNNWRLSDLIQIGGLIWFAATANANLAQNREIVNEVRIELKEFTKTFHGYARQRDTDHGRIDTKLEELERRVGLVEMR